MTPTYREKPPEAHTGGFGEPTCLACHLDAPLNEPSGKLVIIGLPDRFEHGQVYPLTISLTHPSLAIAGFQLSARFREGELRGRQAGKFVTEGSRVAVSELDGIEYVHHTLESLAATRDTARWQIRWTAPSSGGDVELNLAANASNDDASALGDRIYTLSVRIPAQKD